MRTAAAGAAASVLFFAPPPADFGVHRIAPLPTIVFEPQRPAVATDRGRVPADVLETASKTAAPSAPGLRLRAVHRGREWSDHRAELEDRSTADVRAYGIGDLLPHGSILVAIDPDAVEVFVADRELVRLSLRGELKSVTDFEIGRAGQALKTASDIDPAHREAVLRALDHLTSTNSKLVQSLIDGLIDGGDPVVEIILPHVVRNEPMNGAHYLFPSGGRSRTPSVLGDAVIGILEEITGQTFGDPMAPDLGDDDREVIATAWLEWWRD